MTAQSLCPLTGACVRSKRLFIALKGLSQHFLAFQTFSFCQQQSCSLDLSFDHTCRFNCRPLAKNPKSVIAVFDRVFKFALV